MGSDGVPARLGGFLLGRELGEGGMARVYEATRADGSRAAVKILKDDLSRSPEILHRFVREARILATLDHPCVVKVLDVGPPEPPAWFAMELVEGTGLDALMKEGKGLPDAQAAAVMDDVLAALEHAHARGIVHRDLKPENVLMTTAGRARLTDFGIAKVLEGTQLTATGARLGTPQYMAPEQVRGKRSMGSAVDVYAAGVLLYEMLCGHTPFTGEDPVAIGYCHNYEPPPPLKRKGKPVPEDLQAVALKALEKKPAARWRSAGTMRKALQRAARKLGFPLDPVPSEEGPGPAPRPRVPSAARPPVPVGPAPRHAPRPGGEWVHAGLGGLLVVLLAASVALNLAPGLGRPGPQQAGDAAKARTWFVAGLDAAGRGQPGPALKAWRKAAEADPTLLPLVRDHAAAGCRASLAAGRQADAEAYLAAVRWADPGWEEGLRLTQAVRTRAASPR